MLLFRGCGPDLDLTDHFEVFRAIFQLRGAAIRF